LLTASGRESSPPVWRVDPDHPTTDQIAPAVSAVGTGGIVVYPTETFYGLGGHPQLPGAIEKIYRIKRRDLRKPLPLIAADVPAVRRSVASWPTVAERLASAFWPGPLSLVLPASSIFPPALLGHSDKIALRVSSHPVSQLLAAAVGGVLVATSANLSGQPPCRRLEDLEIAVVSKVDGIVDGGETAGQAPSTVVDVSAVPVRLLREGAIAWQAIRQFLRGELALPEM
jgi:L-threonylcarbamoyladenylate synthase